MDFSEGVTVNVTTSAPSFPQPRSQGPPSPQVNGPWVRGCPFPPLSPREQ